MCFILKLLFSELNMIFCLDLDSVELVFGKLCRMNIAVRPFYVACLQNLFVFWRRSCSIFDQLIVPTFSVQSFFLVHLIDRLINSYLIQYYKILHNLTCLEHTSYLHLHLGIQPLSSKNHLTSTNIFNLHSSSYN